MKELLFMGLVTAMLWLLAIPVALIDAMNCGGRRGHD